MESPGMFQKLSRCFFPQILVFFHSSASCFQYPPYWTWLVWLFTHTWEIYLQISRDCWLCSSHLKEKMTLRLRSVSQKGRTALDITGKQKFKWRPWLMTREWSDKWLSGIQWIKDQVTVRWRIWWYRLGKVPRRQTEWKINMGRIYGGGRKKGLRLESTEWGRNWKVPVKNTDESKERVKWGITEQTELLGSDHWKSMRDVLSRAGVSSRYSTLRTKHAVSLLSEHSRKTHGLSLYFHPCPVLTV